MPVGPRFDALLDADGDGNMGGQLMRRFIALVLWPLIAVAGILAPIVSQSPSGGGPAPFFTAFSINGASVRSDFGGLLGFNFTAAKNMTVSSLGRICLTANTQSHALSLTDIASSTVIATVTVAMTGCTNSTFVYGSVSPASLTSGHVYVLSSFETVGADTWYDDTTLLTWSSSNAALNNSTFTSGPATGPFNFGHSAVSYTPVNFKFQ